MTRPEDGDRSDYLVPDEFDGDAWQQFTPYRSGDKSTADQPDQPAGSWWTEQPARSDRATPAVTHELREGERVRSTRGVGGVLGGAVPAGTEGRVVSVEHRLFDMRVTVEFANGYTEVVPPDAVRYENGWF